MRDEEQDQVSISDIPDGSLVEFDTKAGQSEMSYHQAKAIEAHEQYQDRVSAKREKRNHSRRGKMIKVDYRLKGEHWPGLL